MRRDECRPGRKAADWTHDTRAGQPAEASDLIDIDELITAYYDRVPDPSVPEQRVAFGTSGHRGSSLSASFNEVHILATTQAIVDYRNAQGIARAAVPRPRHARPVAAGRAQRDRGARRERRRRARRLARLVGADAGAQPRDPHVQQGPGRRRTRAAPTASSSPRATTRRATAASSTTRRTAAPPTPMPPAGSRTARTSSSPAGLEGVAAHAVQGPRRRRPRRLRLPRRVRARPREHHRRRRDPQRRRAHRRRPAGRGIRRVLGADRRGARPRPHGREPRRRPDLAVHDARLGREDPDGSVVALGDGVARRATRRVRHPHRQRRRRRPARHRHARRGAHEPEPLPRGRDRLPVLAPTRTGRRMPRSARPSSRR